MANGNFEGDHEYYKKAVEDVWLREEGGMIPNCKDYKDFLETAKMLCTVGDHLQSIDAADGLHLNAVMTWKPTCESSFRAIDQALASSKTCDITGVVAIACVRHGCFATNSLANLYCGEQLKNIDGFSSGLSNNCS